MARTLTWKWSCAERQRGGDPQPERVQISAWLVRVLEPLVVASAASCLVQEQQSLTLACSPLLRYPEASCVDPQGSGGRAGGGHLSVRAEMMAGLPVGVAGASAHWVWVWGLHSVHALPGWNFRNGWGWRGRQSQHQSLSVAVP